MTATQQDESLMSVSPVASIFCSDRPVRGALGVPLRVAERAPRAWGYAVRLLHGMLAILAGMLGMLVAVHHPLAPGCWSAFLVAWGLAVCLRPAIWLFVLPAALPMAGFSAWTGWIGVEEFDLLALGAASGCYARMALQGVRRTYRQTRASQPVPWAGSVAPPGTASPAGPKDEESRRPS
jgi:hypothetical protein